MACLEVQDALLRVARPPISRGIMISAALTLIVDRAQLALIMALVMGCFDYENENQ